MKQVLVKVGADDRGVAAIEFALVLPMLLLLVGGVVDFGLAFWSKGLLAGSVAQGAQYAFLTGRNVSVAAIQAIVQQKLSLPASSITVAGPSCNCISGSPAAATGGACDQQCPDGTTAGTYMTISAQYTFQSILPAFSQLVNPVLTETATVRLQ